jgi:hypothetical protein
MSKIPFGVPRPGFGSGARGAALFLLFLLLASSAGGQQLDTIFFDKFPPGDTGWDLLNDSLTVMQLVDGGLVIDQQLNKAAASWAPTLLEPQRDFVIECVLENTGGSDDAMFGLVWGLKDADNSWYFLISGQGNYLVAKSSPDSLLKLARGTSEGVAKGGAKNRLTVRRHADSVTCSVNGAAVATVPFDSVFGTGVGPMVVDSARVIVREVGVFQPAIPAPPVPSDWMTIMREDFGTNARGWSERDNDSVYLSLRDGRYIFELKVPNLSWNTRAEADTNSAYDFDISAVIDKVGGVDNNGYGIAWGHDSEGNGFKFLVSGDGHYKVAGPDTTFIHWTASPFIHRGNARNKLSIRRTGETMSFYVNDRYLNQMPFVPFVGQGLGFDLDSNIRIEATSLVVMQPLHRIGRVHQ